jgi:SAM-dependent methyltransferase
MSEWWTRMFNADYLRSSGLLEERAERESEEVAACLALEPGARILDLAGGYGRIAVPLARRGYRLTVLDLSAEFLRRGQERAAAAGVAIEWLHADLRDVPPSGDFDAVISLFSSFGYFQQDEENERVLHAVGKALRPGGQFLLDMIHREPVVRSEPFYHWVEAPDAITLDETHFDLATGRSNTQRIFRDLRTGERKDYSFSVRLFTPAEYRQMLARAGFTEVLFHGGLDRSPLTRDSRRLLVLAQK